jgi:hypothetical protein
MAELDVVMRALPPAIEGRQAGARLGERILQALLRWDGDQTALKQAVTDVAEHAGDPDALGGLRWQVKKAMTADPALTEQIRELLREHAAVPTPPPSWSQPVERSTRPTRPSTQPTQPSTYQSRSSSGDPRLCPSCGRRGRIAGRDAALRECSCGTRWDMDY